jgi:diaminohydroxyphosphoribosylaminopyrimidine deaminase / 5-amino-6-(5-phosphoribosylamino)uracil reductase
VGYHRRYGGPHAEVEALALAGERARGATIYVTLEPCCHYGKTPPCVDAMLNAGIGRVVVAMADPFPKVAGGGIARLRQSGIPVEVGMEGEAARWLNAPYLKRVLSGLPFVTAKWAMTLDGKIATSSGDSKWISGERSRALVHEVRGLMDAIVVGIGTVLADDPLLTARPAGPRAPARVVLDAAARLPRNSRLVRSAREVPVCVAVNDRADAVSRAALKELGCEVLAFPGSELIPIPSFLEELGKRGVTNVLVEGGGRVLGSFLDAGQLDMVDVFIAPVLEGGRHGLGPIQGLGVAHMADALVLERREISIIDKDIRIRGSLRSPLTPRTDLA